MLIWLKLLRGWCIREEIPVDVDTDNLTEYIYFLTNLGTTNNKTNPSTREAIPLAPQAIEAPHRYIILSKVGCIRKAEGLQLWNMKCDCLRIKRICTSE